MSDQFKLTFVQAMVQLSKGRTVECESDPWYVFRMEKDGRISVMYPDGRWIPAIMAKDRYTSKWRVVE